MLWKCIILQSVSSEAEHKHLKYIKKYFQKLLKWTGFIVCNEMQTFHQEINMLTISRR